MYFAWIITLSIPSLWVLYRVCRIILLSDFFCVDPRAGTSIYDRLFSDLCALGLFCESNTMVEYVGRRHQCRYLFSHHFTDGVKGINIVCYYWKEWLHVGQELCTGHWYFWQVLIGHTCVLAHQIALDLVHCTGHSRSVIIDGTSFISRSLHHSAMVPNRSSLWKGQCQMEYKASMSTVVIMSC